MFTNNGEHKEFVYYKYLEVTNVVELKYYHNIETQSRGCKHYSFEITIAMRDHNNLNYSTMHFSNVKKGKLIVWLIDSILGVSLRIITSSSNVVITMIHTAD